MSDPQLTIVVTTHDRPGLLDRAVESALGQDVPVDVVVVDDGSRPPAEVDRRAKLVRNDDAGGSAAARNRGTRVARTRWVSFLDDDDELLPGFARISLAELARPERVPPVAVLSALEVVDPEGHVLRTHRPPTLPAGAHFGLEEIDTACSYYSKQTLVVDRELLLGIGGFDSDNVARDFTDLLLRLSPVCAIVGLPTVTYRQHSHRGVRMSTDPARRVAAFDSLVRSHRASFEAHPRGYARLLVEHATTLAAAGFTSEARFARLRALRLAPLRTAMLIASPRRRRS